MAITYLLKLKAIEPYYTGKVGRPRNVLATKYVKPGTTDRDDGSRYSEHLKNKSYDIDEIEIIREYKFDNNNYALIFESIMREYYQRKYPTHYVRNDRFEYIEIEEEDLIFFDNKYFETLKYLSKVF